MKDPRSAALDAIVNDARAYGTGKSRPSRTFMIAIGVPKEHEEEGMEMEPDMEESVRESDMFDNSVPSDHGEPDEDDAMLARIAELLARRR